MTSRQISVLLTFDELIVLERHLNAVMDGEQIQIDQMAIREIMCTVGAFIKISDTVDRNCVEARNER